SQGSLTGESLPVEKFHEPETAPAASPTELNNVCFMGTSVESGTATAGAYVNKGDDIVRLDALDTLKLEVPVPEIDLPLVRLGLPVKVTIDALPGQVFSGKVHAIDPVVDPVSRNVRVRARIANPAGTLKPGMFARVVADLGGKTQAILLPEQVIVPRADGNYVFLAVNGKADLRKVTLGKREPGRVEIVSGVAAGDTVVLDGQIKLRPGVPVVTLEQAALMMKKQAGKPAAK
ncbi:MAG TPA: efflux RND transporter periplasmic adaptor subunit, partial [Thiobacillus sp.]